MSYVEAASASEPVPAVPASAPTLAGRRVDRALVTKLIAHTTEVTAGALAVCYGLGMMVLAGQLRALGLHNTGLLTGFEHDDVLMKGFGAIVSHVPSVAALVVLVGMVLKDELRHFVHNALAPAHERTTSGRLWGAQRVAATRVAMAVVFALVLLISTWWEGTVVVAALGAYLLVAVRRQSLMTTGALLSTAAAGVLVLGVETTYFNAQPPPDVHILTTDGRTVDGGLLGVGEGGEWYVVKYDDNPLDGHDDGELQLVPDKQVVDIQIDEPPDTAEPRLYERLTRG